MPSFFDEAMQLCFCVGTVPIRSSSAMRINGPNRYADATKGSLGVIHGNLVNPSVLSPLVSVEIVNTHKVYCVLYMDRNWSHFGTCNESLH